MPTPRIRDVGIKRWLNSDAQRAMHNGHGYDRFYHLLIDLRWSPDGIAKEFNVTEKTIRDWKQYLEDGYVDASPRTH